jgi:hypothetical protein
MREWRLLADNRCSAMRCRPFALRGLALALSLWAALAAPVHAQTIVTEYAFVPSVLAASSPAQVLLTAKVPGPATRVYLNFQPGQLGATTIVDLRDDGLGGDVVAGDRTFTVPLPRDAILAALRADDVNVVFVGFLDVYNGATRLTRLNTFAPVYTPAVGDWPMVQLAPAVRATSRVVNIVDATASPSGSLMALLREFYRWFPDAYDFVNVVFDPSRPQNRFHVTIKNTVTGTGVGMIDATATYGSAGRLLGLNVFPTQNFFDGANAGYIHEIGHQWINFLNVAPLAQGIPHWPYSSMGGGVMGITIPGSGAGGTFACIATDDNGQVRLIPRPNGPVFNPLELYLMGLLPAVQVPEQIVFDDQAAIQSTPCQGQIYGGAVTRVRAQDVINAVGPRVPAAGAAPTHFRTATILVTRTALAPPEAMALFSALAERAEGQAATMVHEGFLKQLHSPFFVAAGGRGTLDTQLDLPSPGAPTGLAVTAVSGNTVTFSWTPPAGGVPPTSYVLEGGLTPGSVLGGLAIAGTPTSVPLGLPTGVFFVRLHAMAGPQRGPASNEVQVFVNVPVPPAAPTNLLGLVNGSALALAWQQPASGGTPTGALLDVSGSLTASLPLGPGDTFQFPSVPAGTYTLAVRATNASGTSAPSNPVTLTFPGPCSGPPQVPAGFAATQSGNTVSVAWNLPLTGPAPTGYALLVTGAFNGTIPLATRGIAGTVGPGSYTLSVSASNPCGSSAFALTQTVVVP